MNKKPAGTPVKFIDTELFIIHSLRFGVYMSAGIIAFGLILLFVSGDSGYPVNIYPTSILVLSSGILQFKASAIISLGLVLLIATPVFRVAASVLLFLIEKDRLYTIITLSVLAILLTSFIVGRSM